MDIFQLLEKINKDIEEIYGSPDIYSELFQIQRKVAETEINRFAEMKDRAVLGDEAARAYVINQYVKIMMGALGYDNEEIDKVVDFNNWLKNPVSVIFEALLYCFDISYLIDNFQLENSVGEKEVKEIAVKEMMSLKTTFNKYYNKMQLVASMVYAREDGQDVIDTLQHHNINEVGVLHKDYIYIVYKGKKLHLSFLSFENKERIINIQKKTTRNAKVQYDEQNPTVVASKYNASRITVAGYSATATEEDLIYNERIFNIKKISLEEMKETYKTINDLIYKLLIINQRGRGSYLVSGSDMGVGKSTFLTATMEKVPDYWGIGILDSQDELQVRKKYPHKNIITLMENPKRTIAQQFQAMLKMARDVLYVGEITKPEEMNELVNSSLRLNSGVGGTIHLISPFEAVANCRNLLMATDMYDNSEKAEEDIARGIDIVIHLAKLPNGRIVVDKVVEICFVNQDLITDIKLEGKIEEKLSNTLNLLQLALSKYLYQKCYQYNEIIRYNRITDRWEPVNLPSQIYTNKMTEYVSKEELEDFKRCFHMEQQRVR